MSEYVLHGRGFEAAWFTRQVERPRYSVGNVTVDITGLLRRQTRGGYHAGPRWDDPGARPSGRLTESASGVREYILSLEGPTKSTQIVGRSLSLLSYGLALLVAVGAFFAPTDALRELMSGTWIVVLSGTLSVLSLVGLGAVVTRRWRVEWVTSTAIAFLLLECSIPAWGRIFSGFPEATSMAAMTALGSVCLAQRALSLWIFAIRTWQVAEHPGDVG